MKPVHERVAELKDQLRDIFAAPEDLAVVRAELNALGHGYCPLCLGLTMYEGRCQRCGFITGDPGWEKHVPESRRTNLFLVGTSYHEGEL